MRPARAEAAMAHIRAEVPQADLTFQPLDLADLVANPAYLTGAGDIAICDDPGSALSSA